MRQSWKDASWRTVVLVVASILQQQEEEERKSRGGEGRLPPYVSFPGAECNRGREMPNQETSCWLAKIEDINTSTDINNLDQLGLYHSRQLSFRAGIA